MEAFGPFTTPADVVATRLTPSVEETVAEHGRQLEKLYDGLTAALGVIDQLALDLGEANQQIEDLSRLVRRMYFQPCMPGGQQATEMEMAMMAMIERARAQGILRKDFDAALAEEFEGRKKKDISSD